MASLRFALLAAGFLAACSPEPAEQDTTPEGPHPWAVLAAETAGVDGNGPVYVALREEGQKRASAWGEGENWRAGAHAALQSAWTTLRPEQAGRIDALEVCMTYDWRDVDLRDPAGALTNIHRGIRALELRSGNVIKRIAPTETIATNRSLRSSVEEFIEEHDAAGDGAVAVRMSEAEQVLLSIRPTLRAVRMFRGNEIVSMNAVHRGSVEAFAEGMADWMFTNLGKTGRMTYKYWPSRGVPSDSNNMIRQWMATVCLGRWAAHSEARGLRERATSNLAFNLDHYYEEENGLGFIVYRGKAKLGAAALACLAIVEHPEREVYANYETGLRATMDHLWQPDGSFRTFLKPLGRNDNWNFYPGEALLCWAAIYDREPSPELLDRFMLSFQFYRQWHREQRNPAFVPWHTQAYELVWRHTKDPELAEFVFEMNDWLLSMQEWDRAVYPDARGRFYDARRNHFGPPHASSTGVYLEGLAKAAALAHALGDASRCARYAEAIRRGLRSSMQLQFSDDVDCYYIHKRGKVLGGLRTTVYDNEIRVDNVQHTLMGVLHILDLDTARPFLPTAG